MKEGLRLNPSIRTKLSGTYLLLIAAILLVVNGLVLRTLDAGYIHDRAVKTLANANIIALAGKDVIPLYDRNTYYFISDFGTQMDARVLVLDANGNAAVDSFGESRLEGQRLDYEEITAALGGKEQTGVHTLHNGERVLYAAVPFVKEKTVSGAVLLVVSLADVDALLAQVSRLMLLVSLAGGVLALLVGLLLAGHFTRPIKQLTEAVRVMAEGHLDRRVHTRSRDEIGQLAQDFNVMAAKLEEVDRTRRQFLADASHELKTPLSSIKALAQSLIDGREQDPAVYREFLGDIDTEVDRMSRLVDSMLRLTKLEDSLYTVQLKEVEVKPLLLHLTSLVQAQAIQKGVELSVSLPEVEGICWPLDADLFSCILLNLLENAVRYTPAGGKVSVRLTIDHETLVVKVADTGIGITPEEIPRIFDRFYRVDQARARASGGAGLGLSIVRQAVLRHGGTISLKSGSGEGTTWEVCFPGH